MVLYARLGVCCSARGSLGCLQLPGTGSCLQVLQQGLLHVALVACLLSPDMAAAMDSQPVALEDIPPPVITQNAMPPIISTTAPGISAAACPEFTGIRKYVCYGPCCGVPWGPGGPICLALSAAAFRYSMPFRYSSWIRSEDSEAEAGTVDLPALAFAAVLFLSSAPRTFGGVAASWTLLVLCLL
jgi:hypothetical protein